ncbi:MAG: DUF3368 domain-containing protein [Phycisphaerales bacterium]|nr:DUF3368 domain-containing protein [Phycisphaerales bacterium]
MIVVSDTGPLNYLAIIAHLDVLAQLYGEVVIPRAVADELTRPSSPETIRSQIQSSPKWLRVDAAPCADPDLSFLGEGEQQAISLASSLGADLLLCDDKDARDAATRKGLRVIGTLGVLQEAAENGLLILAEAIDKLRTTNFRASKSLIERILKNREQA